MKMEATVKNLFKLFIILIHMKMIEWLNFASCDVLTSGNMIRADPLSRCSKSTAIAYVHLHSVICFITLEAVLCLVSLNQSSFLVPEQC